MRKDQEDGPAVQPETEMNQKSDLNEMNETLSQPIEGSELSPEQTQQNFFPGEQRELPDPNENLANKPASNKDALNKAAQQHEWNQTGDDKPK